VLSAYVTTISTFCSPDGTGANFCYVSGAAARACRDVQVGFKVNGLSLNNYFMIAIFYQRFLKPDPTALAILESSSLMRLAPPHPGTSASAGLVDSSPMLERVISKPLMAALVEGQELGDQVR